MAGEPQHPAGHGEPQIGEYLGHYQLIQRLGEGGMGVVFKGFEPALGRHVAIKVLSRKLAADPDFTKRFLHEARSVAAVNHPNLIQIYFIGQQNGLYFFAMEFVEGCSFGGLLHQRKQLPESEALGAILQAAQGLKHAQAHGLIHRDIKPDNLMLTTDGLVKVADFGLAKRVAGEQQTQLTATMAVVGTPTYMSPEQARGMTLDHRTDIYSLGATLYHLLAGRAPYGGSSAMDIMMAHIQAPLPSIRQYNASVSFTAQKILAKMMAKEPKARYQTYDELIQDLTAALYAPGSPAAVASDDPPVPMSTQSLRIGPKPVSPALIAGLAAVVLAVVALGGYYFFAPQSNSPMNENIEAEKMYAQLKAEAAPEISAERFGLAIKILDTWPPRFSKTLAQKKLDAERERVWQTANQSLEQVKKEAAQLCASQKHTEAAALCQRIARTYGVDKFTPALNQIILQEQAHAKTKVASNPAPSSTLISKPAVTPISTSRADGAWLPLDISAACNADIISTDTHKSTYQFNAGEFWPTQSWLTKRNRSEAGIPNDGRVPMPKRDGFFQIRIPPANNVILLTAPKGRQPDAVSVPVLPTEQGRFAQLKILHAAYWGDGVIAVTVGYTDNTTQIVKLDVRDWNAASRSKPLADGEIIALKTVAPEVSGVGGNAAEMIAQTVPLDTQRTLRSLKFSYEAHAAPPSLPPTITAEMAAAYFTASIFAISALPATGGAVPPSALTSPPSAVAVDDPSRWTNAINLLPLIDPQKDAVAGTWTINQGVLTSPPLDGRKCEIPFAPPSEYDLRVLFSLPQKSEDSPSLILSTGQRAFTWKAFRRNIGFEYIGDKSILDTENPSVRPFTSFAAKRQYEAIVQVRTDRVLAFLDGILVSQLKTDFNNMKVHSNWALRQISLLGLGSVSVTNFHEIQIFEVTGKGKFTRPDDLAAREAEKKRTQVAISLQPSAVSTQPTNPQSPVPSSGANGAWTALDLSAACNADVISSASHAAANGFDLPETNGWLTTSALRKKGMQETGLPDDGRVAIPKSAPAGFFQMETRPRNNVIYFTHTDPQVKKPIRVELTAPQQRPYSQISFLHAGAYGDALVRVTLHYDRGVDTAIELKVLDWVSGHGQPLAENQVVAISPKVIHSSGYANYQILAQTFVADPARTLQSLTFTFLGESGQNNPDLYSVGIFAVSALPLESPNLEGASSKPVGGVSDAWVKSVQTMPADEQVKAVVAKLRELNPNLRGEIPMVVSGGKVSKLNFDFHLGAGRTLSNLEPIRALKLEAIVMPGTGVTDLAAVHGMPLKSLDCNDVPIRSLDPLRETPLEELVISGTKVTDLSPLKGCPLRSLDVRGTTVSDLAPLHAMRLDRLYISGTDVTDLTPLQGMPLKDLRFTPQRITRGLEIVRAMKSLETIGTEWNTQWKPAEFWRRFDAGEFGKPEVIPGPPPPNVLGGKPVIPSTEVKIPTLRATLQGHADKVSAIAFSLDGKKLVSGSLDKTIKIWDLATNDEAKTLQGHAGAIQNIAFLPDGTSLVSTSADKAVKVWAVGTGQGKTVDEPVKNVKDGEIVAWAISPNGKYLACVWWSPLTTSMVAVYHAGQAAKLREFKFNDGGWKDHAMALADDGKTLAVYYRKNVVIWNWLLAKEQGTFETEPGRGSGIFIAAFSPDGKSLASGGSNGTNLWDWSKHSKLLAFDSTPGPGLLVFSSDGKTLAAGRKNEVKLWDVAKGTERATINATNVLCIAFSPDGKTLATGSDDKTIKLWDLPAYK